VSSVGWFDGPLLATGFRSWTDGCPVGCVACRSSSIRRREGPRDSASSSKQVVPSDFLVQPYERHLSFCLEFLISARWVQVRGPSRCCGRRSRVPRKGLIPAFAAPSSSKWPPSWPCGPPIRHGRQTALFLCLEQHRSCWMDEPSAAILPSTDRRGLTSKGATSSTRGPEDPTRTTTGAVGGVMIWPVAAEGGHLGVCRLALLRVADWRRLLGLLAIALSLLSI
jgi:hypothetical protein